jgi:pantothenate kinase-related protein Tda10
MLLSQVHEYLQNLLVATQNKLSAAGLDTFYKTPAQTSALLASDIKFYKKNGPTGSHSTRVIGSKVLK